MNQMNMPHRKNLRREEAVARQAESDKLTPQRRLEILDRSLGVGVGAAKERAKLQKKLATTPAQETVTDEPKKVQKAKTKKS